LGAAHDAFWEATGDILRSRVPSAAAFEKTAAKIAGLKHAHGTVLFFEDEAVVRSFQERFPLYKDNFSVWSGNSAGMLQYLVWTGLAAEGLGASLQRYNALVDEWVRERFSLPSS
jgi:predicted oxidoreductase (fatty acid repression mutant protein)